MLISTFRKVIASFVILAFLLNSGIAPVRYTYAQELFQLPQPGTRIGLSPAFTPPILKGIKVYGNDPFRFDFILDKGDAPETDEQLRTDSSRLIKYFLASLTVPEKDLWVNLSPYEKDRIIPDAFGQTLMGRDLLALDYILKQITASVIYPEGDIGKKFWAKVYQVAFDKYGTTDIPVDTFNKVWIVPDVAEIFENGDRAFVVDTKLKVMLESDYLAQSKQDEARAASGQAPVANTSGEPAPNDPAAPTRDIAKQMLREIVIPILEQEVNTGANFAKLRQVYNSLILATWFKKKIKETVLGQVYIDRQKVKGVNIDDPRETAKIWSRYVEAFKKGTYNYIKEEQDALTGETIPRQYFSGGIPLFEVEHAMRTVPLPAQVRNNVERMMVLSSGLSLLDGRSLARPGAVATRDPAMMPPQMYRDNQGRVRLALSSVTNPSLRAFFNGIIKGGLKRNIQIYGETVRDILTQGQTRRMTFFLSPVTEQKTAASLMHDLQAGNDMLLVNMGNVADYNFKIPDLAAGKMMLVFDGASDDLVLLDPHEGWRDIETRQARLVGQQEDLPLALSFPKIVGEMVSLGLAIHPRDKARLDRLALWAEKSLSDLGGEEPTAQDKELLTAVSIYRDWQELLTTGDRGILERLWSHLQAWQEIRSEMENDQVGISELIGVENREDFQAKVEESLRLYSERPNEDEYVSARNTALENEPGGTKEGAVAVGKLENGEWAVSDQFGLIRVKRSGTAVRYAPISFGDMLNVMRGADIEPVLSDQNWTGGVSGEVFRWVANKGRVDYVPEGAYVAAQKRGEALFARDYLSLKAAFEVVRSRIQMNNGVGQDYRSILNGVVSGEGSAEEKISALQSLFTQYESGFTGQQDVLSPVRQLVREIFSKTGEDLVKTGVLHFLSQATEGPAPREQPFLFTDKTVSADVGFYWITELMESGIAGLNIGAEGFLPSSARVGLSGRPLAELLPYSHPFFPYSDFSRKYFEAKVAGAARVELAERFSGELASAIQANNIQADVIIGVPAVPGADNQLDLLLDTLSAKSGIRVSRDAVVKAEPRNKQKLVKGILGKALNVVGAYQVKAANEIAGKTILLIDDHWGTGLTMQEIRRQLLNAGAQNVVMMPLTGSPEKKNTAREVRITKTNQNLNDSIRFVQDLLTPNAVNAWIGQRIEASLPQPGQRAPEVQVQSMARQITDSFFANNVVEMWAGELAAGLISKTDLEARVRRLVDLMANGILQSRKLEMNAGEVTENKVVLTNPQKTLEVLSSSALDDIEMILSDMDESLTGILTPIKPEMAKAIVQALLKNKIFALASQQDIGEVEAYFLTPILEHIKSAGVSGEVLDRLFMFEASGNAVYQYDHRQGRLVRLPGLAPLLTREQGEMTERTMRELYAVRTLHVGNRADAIFTAYYDMPSQAVIGLEVLGNALKSLGVPVEVVSNGSLRVRAVASGLSKKRARDYMSARFPQIPPGKKMVLGDNFDTENPLSDIGLISSRQGEVQALPGIVIHRELMRELKHGDSLTDILQKRGHSLNEGLMPYEASALLDQFRGNIYDSSNGKILTKSEARIQMNPNSLVFFLDDSGAILVNDARVVADIKARPVSGEKPVSLSGREMKLLEWVRQQSRGEPARLVTLNAEVIRAAEFGSFAEAQEAMSKKFGMKAVDGTPYGYIGFWELPGRFVSSEATDRAGLPSNNLSEPALKGGIDLNPDKMNLKVNNAGGAIQFNIDPVMLMKLENASGFKPVIINIQPMTDLMMFLGLKEAVAAPKAS